MAQLTDLDDDLNSSLCDLLSQSNESLEEMYQRDMEEKRAKNEEEEKNRKEEEAELEINNQEKDGEEEKTLSSQAVKRKEEYEKLQKELERAKKIRIEIEEEQKQKNMVAERSIMEDIEKIEKIEREEKEMKEKEEEEKRIRWKPVWDLEIEYKRSLRFANQAREISDHAKLMLDAATLHANKTELNAKQLDLVCQHTKKLWITKKTLVGQEECDIEQAMKKKHKGVE